MSRKSAGLSYDAKTIIVVLLFVFIYPLGWVFMLLWMHWLKWIKVFLTLPVVLFVLVIMLFIWNPARQVQQSKCAQECSANDQLSNDNSCVNACMQRWDRQRQGLPVSFTNLNQLELTNSKMIGNSNGYNNPTFTASLHNASTTPAQNIVIKIDFFNSTDTDPNATPQDTEYIKVANYLGAGDSTSIDTLVRTNFDTVDAFRWKAQVYSAEEVTQ